MINLTSITGIMPMSARSATGGRRRRTPIRAHVSMLRSTSLCAHANRRSGHSGVAICCVSLG
jgi:hypothetical protein